MGIKDIKEMERIKELDPTGENTKIIEAYERLEEENPGFISAYEYERDQIMVHNTDIRLAKEEAREEGLKVGIEEGAKQNSIEIAKSLLKLDVNSLEQIQMVTGLTIEELEKLKKSESN